MPDMLVKLYELPPIEPYLKRVEESGIRILRPLTANKDKVVQFVAQNFPRNWANECDCMFSRNPIPCFVAEKDGEVLGFACYDAVALNFFGPTGVSEALRGKGVGAALLLKALYAMKDNGYGYAIIGWADGGIDFYKKTVGAVVIENSFPGIYADLIPGEK